MAKLQLGYEAPWTNKVGCKFAHYVSLGPFHLQGSSPPLWRVRQALQLLTCLCGSSNRWESTCGYNAALFTHCEPIALLSLLLSVAFLAISHGFMVLRSSIVYCNTHIVIAQMNVRNEWWIFQSDILATPAGNIIIWQGCCVKTTNILWTIGVVSVFIMKTVSICSNWKWKCF